MTKLRILLLSFVLMQFFLPVHAVLADTGPKPTMEFEFKHGLPDGQVTIVSGILYECDQADCIDAAPLEELGPQGLYCKATSCRALGYGFAPYHILEIEFSDGVTRRSNIFETAGFASKYTVTIQPHDLLIEAQFSLGVLPRTGTVIVACIGVLVLGVAIIGLIVFLMRRSKTT
ncbi:MAG: hypothetical protein Q7J80_15165 [Anaerolineales bacterium]|nr:hypothetical protein [Anaerolineales bacterium]